MAAIYKMAADLISVVGYLRRVAVYPPGYTAGDTLGIFKMASKMAAKLPKCHIINPLIKNIHITIEFHISDYQKLNSSILTCSHSLNPRWLPKWPPNCQNVI